MGDVTGAQSYASTAKCLSIGALALGILLIVGLVFAYLKAYQMALQMANNRGY